MNVADLPIVIFSEEEIKHLQRMADGDGDGCPIMIHKENEKSKKNKENND